MFNTFSDELKEFIKDVKSNSDSYTNYFIDLLDEIDYLTELIDNEEDLIKRINIWVIEIGRIISIMEETISIENFDKKALYTNSINKLNELSNILSKTR